MPVAFYSIVLMFVAIAVNPYMCGSAIAAVGLTQACNTVYRVCVPCIDMRECQYSFHSSCCLYLMGMYMYIYIYICRGRENVHILHGCELLLFIYK